VFLELKKENASVDQNSPHVCQLLSHAEAIQITAQTDPASTPFIMDLSRLVTRMSSDMLLYIIDASHPFHPRNQSGVIYLYWRLVGPVSPLTAADSREEVGLVRITLLAGTTFKYFFSTHVHARCPYGEFITAMAPFFISTSRPSWGNILSKIISRQVFPGNYIRIYLYH
jgi:hypothetical protein